MIGRNFAQQFENLFANVARTTLDNSAAPSAIHSNGNLAISVASVAIFWPFFGADNSAAPSAIHSNGNLAISVASVAIFWP